MRYIDKIVNYRLRKNFLGTGNSKILFIRDRELKAAAVVTDYGGPGKSQS